MSDDRPVLLFGETYHHPNILYRTGFLVPDPVVVVDRGGDDTVLWASALEEGRARKESSVGAGAQHRRSWTSRRRAPVATSTTAGRTSSPPSAASTASTPSTSTPTFPPCSPTTCASNDVDVRPRTDIYQQRRRIKTAAGGGVDHRHRERGHGGAAEGDRRDRGMRRSATACCITRVASSPARTSSTRSRATCSRTACSTEDSICCGGPESADPHRAMSDVIRAGLPIVLDIYPFDKRTRYWGDMTRTVVRGTPPPEVERMWDAVLEAQQAGLDTVQAGCQRSRRAFRLLRGLQEARLRVARQAVSRHPERRPLHPRDRARARARDPRVPAGQRGRTSCSRSATSSPSSRGCTTRAWAASASRTWSWSPRPAAATSPRCRRRSGWTEPRASSNASCYTATLLIRGAFPHNAFLRPDRDCLNTSAAAAPRASQAQRKGGATHGA